MTTTQEYVGTLVVICCGECGTHFGLEQRFQEDRRRSGERFYCPNGHPRVYRETTEDKLRQQLSRAEGDTAYFRDRMREEQQAAQHARNQARAQKAAKTRLKNRIAAGVCPCCNRTFQNVARHMKSQHPEFVEATDG